MSADNMSDVQYIILLDGCTIRAVNELSIDKDTGAERDFSLEGGVVELVGEDSGHGR